MAGSRCEITQPGRHKKRAYLPRVKYSTQHLNKWSALQVIRIRIQYPSNGTRYTSIQKYRSCSNNEIIAGCRFYVISRLDECVPSVS